MSVRHEKSWMDSMTDPRAGEIAADQVTESTAQSGESEQESRDE